MLSSGIKSKKSDLNNPPKNKKFSENVKWKITNKIHKKIGIPNTT